MTCPIRRLGTLIAIASLASLSCAWATAQAGASGAQANNPIADMTALNFQNYYIGHLSGTSETANQFWIRYARPFSIAHSNWIMRASLPLYTYPVGPLGNRETGLSDLNILSDYLIDTGNPAVSFGIGPQFTFPTATEPDLGSQKWSAGLVNVLFNATSPRFQYGYLLSWQHSFAGNSNRIAVNTALYEVSHR